MMVRQTIAKIIAVFEDPEFVLQKNAGASSARNYGIENNPY
jgi:hypothetical protein